MTARAFILKSYRARKTAQEAERARYLRKLEPVHSCRTCYGMSHRVVGETCAGCGLKAGPA